MEQLNVLRTWLQSRTKPSVNKVMGAEKQGGYVAVFSGAGNYTLAAAETLAKEAKGEVHRVDLSQIAGKYIGETEKNLAALFKKAEEKNWILFFDEADALFGKRTDVRDSHDRYANVEISYLLQRIEAYTGLVILATASEASLDAAVLRRSKTVIRFPKT